MPIHGFASTVFLLVFSAAVFHGCAQQPADPAASGNTAPAAAAQVGCQFRFSTIPVATGANTDNWCRSDFSEAIPIGAETGAPNHYYFIAKTGSVYKLNVVLGLTTFSGILQLAGPNEIEVYTSSNFPECLSNKSNYNLSESRYFLDYNNQKYISITLRAEPVTGGARVYVEVPPESQYGIAVNRCSNCPGK